MNDDAPFNSRPFRENSNKNEEIIVKNKLNKTKLNNFRDLIYHEAY